MMGRSRLVRAAFVSASVLAIGACNAQFGSDGFDAATTHDDAPAGPADARPAPGSPDGRPTYDAAPGSPDAAVGSGASFRFAIVGDTRPAGINGTSSYPTAIITKIWGDIENESPRPDFAVSSGDYMFASTTGSEQNPQLDLYLGARAQFTNPVYAALGNHECTGATTSNCGSGTTDGVTKNFSAFMTRMASGHSDPWYSVSFADPNGAWTAKVVLVAANAWTSAQATWLDQTLSQPTTYTFVVRHESNSASTAPGVSPSRTIIDSHPYTLLIVGHAHTYQHVPSDREVIVGNGGAPLVSGTNYGYGIVDRRTDGTIQFTEYDYSSHAVMDQFAVHADGSPAP